MRLASTAASVSPMSTSEGIPGGGASSPPTVTHAPAATREPGAPAYRFLIEGLLFLTYACFGLSWIAVAPLMGALQSQFGVGSASVALLNTAVSAAKVVAPLVAGVMAARVGLRRTLSVGAFCIVAGAGVALTRSFPVALAARFVFGCGGAVVVTLLGPVVLEWFEPRERTVVNSLNGVAVNTGIAITLFTTSPLAARLGWQRTLLLYSAMSLALALAWLILGRDRRSVPSQAATLTDGKRQTAASPGGPTSTSAPAPTARYRDVWVRRETWLVTLGFLAPLALYLAYNTWLPRFLVETRGFQPGPAAHLMGLCNLVGIPSAIAGGLLSARIGLRRPFLIVAGLGLTLAGLGLLFVSSATGLTLCAVILGVSLFVASSPLLTTALELPGMTRDHVGLMMGTVLSGSYLVSSVSPVLVGWLRDRGTTLRPGLAVWAAGALVVTLVGVLLPETGARAARAR